jgi:hypothetical protein
LRAWEVFIALVAGILICEGLLTTLSHSTWTAVPPMCHPGTKTIAKSDNMVALQTYSQHVDQCACELDNPVLHVPPSAVASAERTGRLPSCFSADLQTTAQPTRSILIVGDSHSDMAEQTLGAIRPVRELYNITKFEEVCIGLTSQTYFLKTSHGSECFNAWEKDQYREGVFAMVQSLQENDILVLAHRGTHLAEPDLIRHLHSEVVKRNASLILFGSHPEMKHDMTRCVPTWVAPHAAEGCATSFAEQRALQQESSEVYRKLAAELPSTHHFERWQLFCDSATCDAFIPGTCSIGYKDATHASLAGNRYTSPFMCSFMNEHGLL